MSAYGELLVSAVTEFHLKLIAASSAGLADPIAIIDAPRRDLLRRPRERRLAAIAEPRGSDASLLLEGMCFACKPTCAGWRLAKPAGLPEEVLHDRCRG